MNVDGASYTVKTASGVTDFFFAIDIIDAWSQAYQDYEDVDSVRESFYGEWDCGTACGYEEDGKHYWINEQGAKVFGNKPSKSEIQKFS